MGGLITSIYSWPTDRLEFWIMKYLTFASLRWEIYFEKCNQGVIILHLEKLMLLWEEWASSTIGLKNFEATFDKIFPPCTGNSLSDQHIVPPIHPNMTIDFVRFTILNLQNLCFEFQNNCVNLCKSEKISRCILGYLVTKQGRNHKENLGSTSAMVGKICPPWLG